MWRNKRERETLFMNVSLFFGVLYYIVTLVNVYIAIVQLINGHFFYFVYYAGFFTLEKMALLIFLRRVNFERANYLVLGDLVGLGFLSLIRRKEIQDVCTFFIAKMYLSIIPTVYLQLWFFFGFQLIEKDYMEFGWLRPSLMYFSIVGYILILAFARCMSSLSISEQSKQLTFELHKLRYVCLFMNPFGYEFCLYSLLTVQIQFNDKFGICFAYYGFAFQLLIEIAKKFFSFSLNINQFGMLNLIRRTGVLSAIQFDKGLSLPEYLKVALNFSGIVDLLVHLTLAIFASESSSIESHDSKYQSNFSHEFLGYENLTIQAIAITYIIIKIIFAGYISTTLWVMLNPDLTIEEVISKILSSPKLNFVVIFSLKKGTEQSHQFLGEEDNEVEMQDYRISQDLLQFMDERELSKEESKLLNQQQLIQKQSQDNERRGAPNAISLLTRLVQVQQLKCFFEIHKTLTVSQHLFHLDLSNVRIPDWVLIRFLAEIPIFPKGVKVGLSQLQKSHILFDRFFRFGIVSDEVFLSIDCSKQTQRHIKQTNVAMLQFIALGKILLNPEIQRKYLLDLDDPTRVMLIKRSTPLLHVVRLI